jgi:PAS domain S-box-containing protein
MSASLDEKGKTGYRQVCVHGLRNCIEFCKDMEAGSMHHCVVEMNVCEHGCIKGPAVTEKEAYPFKIRLDMEEMVFPEPVAAEELRNSTDGVLLHKEFRDRSLHEFQPSEEEIRAVLVKTGKHSPADELNCGACGYSSCREKAVAVLQGKAEVEMCIPYLTSQAESMANLILKESPNAVIIVDAAQRILEYSDIGERFFGVTREQALNRFLWELIDPKDCETVYRTHQNIYGKRVYYEQYDLWTLQNVVYIPKQDSTLITFIDVTTQEKRMQKERERRDATVEMAQNVIREQMFTAQKIAGLLGETTAETKMTLTKLMNAMQMGENWGGENVEAQADEAAAAEEDDSDAPEEAEDLPIVSAPVKKPKLKINTKYAKPAQNVETESNSGEAGERQRGAAEES